MRHHPLAILCVCLMLAACGTDKTTAPTQQTGEEGLPQPDAAGGSVTGMPNPGTPSVLPPPTEDEDVAIDNGDASVATEDGSVIDSNLPVAPPTLTVEGTLGKLPADSMPVMPAHPPLPPEPSEQSRVVLPPQS